MPSKLNDAVLGLGAPGDDPRNPWFSWSYVSQNTDTLLAALREHLFLTLVAVTLATVIAIPLAILAYRVGSLAGPILGFTGVLYTIPSLALFAFLAPFTGIVKPTTVLIGLTMYALLTIVRNTLTALRQVPADVLDSARGMGYGKRAMLWRIELPLALPGIMTGLRIATVSTVALVTVGELAGWGGLGELIIGGFNSNYYRPQIMTATLLCVALALVLDLVLLAVGRIVMPWTRRRAA
ncbi:ABC transporter permease [Catellatospora citrea]|uniref:Glycine/betaine ABC transporter permease n=1 Tax=Catellatospora citrea TaxID=53366 RepID=A0A8J3P312_9ACTN|nr:ABC transporter permease [Catellatospora citrea]RKE06498.1 osmoprotectant transport system permease protein [Catellatospora citrea]GIG01802.1 glycine/betaine ABC transporter permease [Catellatospora citrea]